ncbi:hypothetical protein Thi970DRAFT_00411, partial [Thiorhodovibrio frisius]
MPLMVSEQAFIGAFQHQATREHPEGFRAAAQ